MLAALLASLIATAPARAGGRPSAACPHGTRRVRTEDPFVPVRCAPTGERRLPLPRAYRRYEVPRALAFEYPGTWHVTDAWQDDVPSLYIQPEPARGERPVVLSVSLFRHRGPAFLDMGEAIRREFDWHAATDAGTRLVAGVPARVLEVPRHATLAYLPTSDGYFVIGFSAPEDLFASYAPAFARLLGTLRLAPKERSPLGQEREL